MSLRDNEQRILDAIENQLRAEEPQLIDYFSAFGSTVPLIKPVRGWDRAASSKRTAGRGRHRPTGRHRYGEILIISAAVLVPALLVVGIVWWIIAAFSMS
jgi:Protein of unknown function (DUF3040)